MMGASSGMSSCLGSDCACRASAFTRRFHLLECWPAAVGNRAASEFGAHNRRCPFHVSDDTDSEYVIELAFAIVQFGHVRGQRPDEAVTQENPQKSAYESRSYFVANLFGRPA